MMIATIIGSNASSSISYVLTDHLQGSSILTNASGTIPDPDPLGGAGIES
jgi:hypothetical protein